MENKVSLRHYIEVLVRWRRIIFWNTFIITSSAIAISLFIPEKYTSHASLLPPLPGTPGMDVFGANVTSAMTGMSALRGGLGMATPSDLFAVVLQSERVMDGVIEDCHLMTVYETVLKEDTYGTLSEATAISVIPEGIIHIAVTAKSRELAQKMAESYIKNLDKVNRDVVMSIGKRDRTFLDSRLQEVKTNLTIAENSLRKFQETHKTISIEEEIEPILETMADLKAQILASEIRLGILRKYATEENPEVINIKSQLVELNERLHSIESTGNSEHFGIGFSVPVKDIPAAALQLARLERDMLVQEKLFALLTEKYEQAKIQEAKDTPTVSVLEEPRIPERKSYPKRSKIVIATFVFSFSIAVILAFSMEYVRNIGAEEKEKWQDIARMMRRKNSGQVS